MTETQEMKALREGLAAGIDALICESCFGSGTVTTVLDELDECPDCVGQRRNHPALAKLKEACDALPEIEAKLYRAAARTPATFSQDHGEVERVRAAFRSEFHRQAEIGAGDFWIDRETGLWGVNLDLDADTFVRAALAALRPLPEAQDFTTGYSMSIEDTDPEGPTQ
jgi:hypothetical protein